MAFDKARDFAVERRKNLIEHFDERHVEPAMDQILGHLEANESAADDHRARRSGRSSGSRNSGTCR